MTDACNGTVHAGEPATVHGQEGNADTFEPTDCLGTVEGCDGKDDVRMQRGDLLHGRLKDVANARLLFRRLRWILRVVGDCRELRGSTERVNRLCKTRREGHGTLYLIWDCESASGLVLKRSR